MKNKRNILITNDDGIFAKGIRSLIEVAKEFGNVCVVAPDKPQSGMGHAITINNLLRLSTSDLFDKIPAYTCSGTPVDCIKIGIYEVLKNKPDLILSGINHGANTSTNVLYSGTMSAAVEGAMEKIPSVGFSLCSFDSNADFTLSKHVVWQVLEKILQNQFPNDICLNVNIPSSTLDNYKGIKICRAANALWEDRFDKRIDQHGNPYYWLTGDFSHDDDGEDTDLFAIKNDFASIVPIQYDMTAYHSIAKLHSIF
ncbi:MAG: 5'/3'-nucleotidase SurE [Flavobacteriia bacterium]|nr:5'/3'-nucleotidase SurE [Flavobacteriia bacterium]